MYLNKKSLNKIEEATQAIQAVQSKEENPLAYKISRGIDITLGSLGGAAVGASLGGTIGDVDDIKAGAGLGALAGGTMMYKKPEYARYMIPAIIGSGLLYRSISNLNN